MQLTKTCAYVPIFLVFNVFMYLISGDEQLMDFCPFPDMVVYPPISVFPYR